MRTISRKLKTWLPNNIHRGLDIGKIRTCSAVRNSNIKSYSLSDRRMILDVLKSSFFRVLMEDKKFSIDGIGIIHLAYSIGVNKKLQYEICITMILSDMVTGTAKQIEDGILKCFNKEALEKQMKEHIS